MTFNNSTHSHTSHQPVCKELFAFHIPPRNTLPIGSLLYYEMARFGTSPISIHKRALLSSSNSLRSINFNPLPLVASNSSMSRTSSISLNTICHDHHQLVLATNSHELPFVNSSLNSSIRLLAQSLSSNPQVNHGSPILRRPTA